MVQRFIQMKVAYKLTLGFGIVLLLMLSTLAVDVVASTQQSSLLEHIVHHLNPEREAAHEIATLVRAADDDGALYLLTSDPRRAASSLHNYA